MKHGRFNIEKVTSPQMKTILCLHFLWLITVSLPYMAEPPTLFTTNTLILGIWQQLCIICQVVNISTSKHSTTCKLKEQVENTERWQSHSTSSYSIIVQFKMTSFLTQILDVNDWMLNMSNFFFFFTLSTSPCAGPVMMSGGQRGSVPQPGMPQVSSNMEDEILMDLL